MQHVGVDIVEISRIKTAVSRWNQSFLQRVYTQPELELYTKNTPSLAARFSGKEAVIKALNCRSISLKEVEILSSPIGKPFVRLYGKARLQAEKLGILNLSISLSHCREYAVAYAVCESKN